MSAIVKRTSQIEAAMSAYDPFRDIRLCASLLRKMTAEPLLPTIGFLGSNASAWRPWTEAFVGRLRELGWIESRTIAIEYRWSEDDPSATPRSQPSLSA
jgi:hypothetical protein